MNKLVIAVVMLCLTANLGFTQNQRAISKQHFIENLTKVEEDVPKNVDHYIRCGTVEAEAERRKNNPSIPSDEKFEEWMKMELIKLRSIDAQSRRTTYRIPYIVHVVHSNDAVGTGENLSASQVYAQMQQLNDDFRRENSDAGSTPAVFTGVAAGLDIEFVPAVVDPAGNPLAEPGINRVNGTALFGISSWGQTNTNNTLKPNTIFDPTRYLNVWSVNLSGGLLGYAQFPSNSGLGGLDVNGGGANTDGVVCLYSSFGSISQPGTAVPYNLGRTTTHEVGHWLGMRHIWGDGNCSVDDFCTDTPNQNGSNGTGSPCVFPGRNSCNSGAGDLPDMFQNYMDYSDDGCMNLFTEDQMDRVEVVLQNSPRRASLLTSNVWQAGNPSDTCLAWLNPSPATGWIDFDSTVLLGAPCQAGQGCESIEITEFEVWSAEAYSTGGFVAGQTYTFSMCNGPGAGSWIPDFTIIAPSGAIDAYGEGDGDACSITWTASESGRYLIVINEEGQCGGGVNTNTDNGYPKLSCAGDDEFVSTTNYTCNPSEVGSETTTISGGAANGCDLTTTTNTVLGSPANVIFTPFDGNPICSTEPAFSLAGLVSPSGGTFSGPGMSGAIFSPADAGVGNNSITYSYDPGPGSECPNSKSIIIQVQVCTGIDRIESITSLMVFPNPVQDVLSVNMNLTASKDAIVRIVDALGKIHYTNSVVLNQGNNQLQIPMEDYAKGTYWFEISIDNQVAAKMISILN